MRPVIPREDNMSVLSFRFFSTTVDGPAATSSPFAARFFPFWIFSDALSSDAMVMKCMTKVVDAFPTFEVGKILEQVEVSGSAASGIFSTWGV